ncbi:hypothetical protein V8J82_10675 [Gymnodinialimonas sp. 2305UL16-5]|uniref:hypothetical protein n=1 Tax=Gymnodinialimonas mytili TaxID=3126503 RepID=UPI0030A927F6
MILRALPLLVAALAALAACGPPQPMTMARAQRLCADEARLADGFAGRVGVGGGSEGFGATGSLTVTNDIFNPQSEDEARRNCVTRRLNGDDGPPRRPTFAISIGGDSF